MNLLFPFCGIVTGILVAYLGVALTTGICLIIIGILFYLLLLFLSSSPTKSFKINPFHHIWIFLLFSGIGVLVYDLHRPLNLSPSQLSQITGFDAYVADVRELTSGELLTLDIISLHNNKEHHDKIRNLEIRALAEGPSLSKGDLIRTNFKPGKIKEDTLQNKFKINFNTTPYFMFLSEEECKKIGETNNLITFFQNIRDKIEISLEKSELERPTSEFIISLLLGDRYFLSPDVKKSFSSNGISHILAVSGMHIGILTFFLFGLFFPLKILGFQRLPYFLTIICLWAFALLTGLSPSTLRACLMTTFLVCALLLQRKKSAGNSLLCATIIILICDPGALFNIGLQLSFVCVASLIMFVKPLNTVDLHTHPKLYKIVSSVLVTLIATFATWALVSYYFQTIPLFFLPANMLLLPVLPWFMGVSIIYTIFLVSGWELNFLSTILDRMYEFINYICEVINSIEFNSLEYKVSGEIVIIWLSVILLSGIFVNKFVQSKRN